jgi:hypothetical protein
MGRLTKQHERALFSRSFCADCARPLPANVSTCASATCSKTPMSSTLTSGKSRSEKTAVALTMASSKPLDPVGAARVLWFQTYP